MKNSGLNWGKLCLTKTQQYYWNLELIWEDRSFHKNPSTLISLFLKVNKPFTNSSSGLPIWVFLGEEGQAMLCGASLVFSTAVCLVALGHPREVQGWSACPYSRCSAAVSCSIPHVPNPSCLPLPLRESSGSLYLLPVLRSQTGGEERWMQFPLSS